MTDTKHRLLACALLVCMMVCVFAGLAATPADAADVRATNWMSAVPDSTKLSNMSIPGTHDSCTQNVDMRYIFQCQDVSIATQLKYGYRYLDMRLVLEKRSGQETLVLKHNIARCKVSDSPFSRTLTLCRSYYVNTICYPRHLHRNTILHPYVQPQRFYALA